MKPALLLIDIQNDYFPGGSMEVEGSTEASMRATELLAVFRKKNLPVIHVQHVSIRPGATFFLPGTRGIEIHENALPAEGETVIQKNYPNTFRNTPLLEHLRIKNIRHLVIIGMMTHMCVDATTRAAFDYGLQCTVVYDACATRALSFGDKLVSADQVHAAFLAALNGIYANVVSTQALMSSFV
ncbi:MAG: cysteine hydrolase [Desulfomonile tiedjei]|uniref:Cysteine hydrolase n=1 Tax=Desulfomonile tiedjei TaxID=2358 RepID=A0A9D6V547_9BACT|nr:cysteine hydrolase [Desulfomonile tiedjei]